MKDQSPDPWARAAFDALGHGHGHAVLAGEGDRRQALVSLDQAIENLWAGYLRLGPGIALADQAAATARAPGSSFWPKARWFTGWVSDGASFPWSADDVNEVRSERNALQHAGEWRVPPIELVELARRMAVAAVRVLTEMDVSPRYPAVASQGRPADLPASTGKALTGQALAEQAWLLAREIDPDSDGLHPRTLARVLLERGVGIRPPIERRLYDALNHAHLRFQHRDGVFIWKAAGNRDPTVGLSGRQLAEACYAAAMFIDPDREGVSYRFDIIPVLQRWQVPIKHVDIGRTVNSALRSSPHFERRSSDKPGFYRWTGSEKTPLD